MTSRMVALALAAALAGGCAAPDEPDWGNARRAIDWLERSDDPEAAAFLEWVAAGPEAVAAERERATRAGIPLSFAEFPASETPPEEDARPLYARASDLYNESVELETQLQLQSLGLARAPPQADREAARRVFAELGEVWDLIEQATARPAYASETGSAAEAEEAAVGAVRPLRDAVGLLRARAFLLAAEGRHGEALDLLEQALAVPRHALALHGISGSGYLVPVATAATLLTGLEEVLQLAGPDQRVTERVRQLLGRRELAPPYRRAVTDHMLATSLALAEIRALLREHGQPGIDALLPLRDGETFLAFAPRPESSRPFRAREEAWLLALLDATEAEALRQRWALATAAGLPYLDRAGAFATLELPPGARFNLFWSLVEAGSGPLEILHRRDARLEARRGALLAGAAALEHRARSGAFPERLEEALPEPPLDPFSAQPLQYRREGEGFVVYSVGESGEYDGASPAPPEEVAFHYPAPAPD